VIKVSLTSLQFRGMFYVRTKNLKHILVLKRFLLIENMLK